MRFPFASTLATAQVVAATLHMTRFVNKSSAAHTLSVAVVTAGITGGTYTIMAGPITWSVGSGAGDKNCDVTALMATLLADPANRYLMVYSPNSGTYTEFRAIEYNSGSNKPWVDLDYNQGLVEVFDSGYWRLCEVYVFDGYWRLCEPKIFDGYWRLLG